MRTLAILLGIGGVLGCSKDDPCRAPLDQVGCKPTFDQQVEWALAAIPDCPLAGPCGPHLVWRTALGLGALVCVYDNSGQQLLSAARCSDVPLARGGNCMRGGQSFDLAKDCDTLALPRTCASGDGGT